MIKGALFDSQATLLHKDSVETHAEKGETELIDSLVTLVNLLQKENTQSASIGIGIAGVIDSKKTTLLESPNLPHLHNFQLKKLLEAELHIPVFLENDANCAALGELWSGAGKGLENFLFFTLGTGIGSGLILNGSLWSGEQSKAGEFGHLIVQPNGAQCGCGNTGCLEAHASGTAIIRMAREALSAGRYSSLKSIYDDNPDLLTPETIYLEAKKGDALSLEVYHEAARYLAIGIADVNYLLDIHHFIVGGGVSKGFDIMRDIVLAQACERVFTVSSDKIRIHLSRLGNDAGIFGAGYLAKKCIS